MEIITLMTEYTAVTVVTIVCLLFFSIKTIVESVVWVYKWIMKWHNRKNRRNNKEESVEDRIKKLENHDKWQYEKLVELTDSIKELKDLMISMKDDNDKFVVVTCRSQLYRIHKEAVAQGYITKECLKTFSETGKRYESAGGDDIYHDKLYPEVMALPIKD